MTEQQALLKEMIDRLFADLAAARPAPELADDAFAARWSRVSEMALSSLLVPEEAGGFAGGGTEAWLLCHSAGRHAIDLPVVESAIASGLLARAGMKVPDGVISLAAGTEGHVISDGQDVAFEGVMAGVPWGRRAGHVVGLVEVGSRYQLVSVSTTSATIERRENAAGEPRDVLTMNGAAASTAPLPVGFAEMRHMGALARAAQIAGASRTALEMALTHVKDRSQFGKALSKLQAVQHALATLAEQVAAAEAASRAAYEGEGGLLAVASAKIVSNRAGRVAGGIAHQMHGAIGFTWEYDLHHVTRRLIAWQSEFGNTRYWTGRLGSLAAQQGPLGFWPFLVASPVGDETLREWA
jgi:acyl-CoA dehydrogenase